MVYQGSKSKISKYLKPVIESYIKPNTVAYIEPFVGGCNMIDKIECSCPKRGYDANEYLIELFNYAKNGGTLPEYISKEQYYEVKNNKEKYPKWYVGFIGFIVSFRGKFFGGYINPECILKASPRKVNYQERHINNFKKQIPNLKDVELKHSDYKDLSFNNCVIYCDPPYRDTTKYKASAEFDYEEFYNWCRKMCKYNTVLISEYDMPEDFECIWSKEHWTTLSGYCKKKTVEKLFILKQVN